MSAPFSPSSTSTDSALVQTRYQLLRELSEAINSSLLLDDIFDALGDVLGQYFPYTEALIALLDDSLNGIKLKVRIPSAGFVESQTLHHPFVGNDPILRRLAHQAELTVVTAQDTTTESLFLPPWTESGLVIPLINKGLVRGALALVANTPNAFNTQHHTLLADVAPPLAVAMENAQLFWQIQQQASREFLINHITKAIRQSISLQDIATAAADVIGRTTGVSRCIIRMFAQPLPQWDNNLDESPIDPLLAIYQVPTTPPINEAALLTLDLEQRLFEHRLKNVAQPHLNAIPTSVWNPFVLNNGTDCPAFLGACNFLNQFEVQSCLVVPIRHNDGACVGSLTLHQCQQPRVWLEDDLALFNALAEHLGVAFHQGRLYSSLAVQKNQLQTTLNELQQAQMQLIQSEKMAVIGQFVAGIAHDVNTPLGAMSSNQQTLAQCVEKIQHALEIQTPIEPRWLETMKRLLDVNTLAANRINDIVKNLRNFARLDASDCQPVDLRESWHSTRLLLERPLMDHHIIYTFTMEDSVPLVVGYPGLLNQVWMNLLVNAIQALEGHLKPQIVVAITHQTDAQTVTVTVTDNGPGIPADHRHRVFDPGFTTKGVGVGTGLGLALCYRMVAKHGGTITVNNALGFENGTTLSVVLPLNPTNK
ncbi:MAG: GAF domain-containing sensor histidine kinase [Vampirovibrionales bacterium]